MTVYTGDILIKEEPTSGNLDMSWKNGQPEMTDGLETYFYLAVFGEDSYLNALEKKDSAKMKSRFPEVVKRAVVNDRTKADGIRAIEQALQHSIKEKIVKKFEVTGEVFSTYGIKWLIKFWGLDGLQSEYLINWEKGSLTTKFIKGIK